jgi:hypothetical protein
MHSGGDLPASRDAVLLERNTTIVILCPHVLHKESPLKRRSTGTAASQIPGNSIGDSRISAAACGEIPAKIGNAKRDD